MADELSIRDEYNLSMSEYEELVIMIGRMQREKTKTRIANHLEVADTVEENTRMTGDEGFAVVSEHTVYKVLAHLLDSNAPVSSLNDMDALAEECGYGNAFEMVDKLSKETRTE